VGILHEDGKPAPGFSLEECDLLNGDHFDKVVSWKSRTDVSSLAGKAVRLRMAMRGTRLYALQSTSAKQEREFDLLFKGYSLKLTAMRRFLPILIFAVGSLTSIAAAEKPNILLIIADDLNCELGCYGSANAKTPHIDAFARTAMRFERAYCQAPLCNPSRSSLLTGLRPASVGVLDNSTHFRWRWPDLQTLPQQFRAAGWHTAAFGKIFHGASLQIEDGASWDEGPGVGKAITPMPKTSADETEPKPPRVGAPNPWDAWGPADQDDAATSDGKAARLAAAGIARMKDRPFFIAVGFKKPHAPLHAPAKYFALHDATSLRLPPTFLAPDEPPRSGLPAAALRPTFDLFGSQRARPGTRDEALDAIAAYHSCVSFTDAQTGLVLDALEKHGLAGRTIVVFTSDHGFHLGEHGLWGKLTLFEECLRVPLLIAGDASQRDRVQQFSAMLTTKIQP